MSRAERSHYYLVPIPFLMLSLVLGAGVGFGARFLIPHPDARISDGLDPLRRADPEEIPAEFEALFPDNCWAFRGRGKLWYDEEEQVFSGYDQRWFDDEVHPSYVSVTIAHPDNPEFGPDSGYPMNYVTDLSPEWRLGLDWEYFSSIEELRAIAERCTDPRIREELLAAIEETAAPDR